MKDARPEHKERALRRRAYLKLTQLAGFAALLAVVIAAVGIVVNLRVGTLAANLAITAVAALAVLGVFLWSLVEKRQA